MESTCTQEFWARYNALSPELRNLADGAFERWKANPKHPGLDFKEVNPREGWWSARIGIHLRALATKDGDRFVWWMIGTKEEIKRLLK